MSTALAQESSSQMASTTAVMAAAIGAVGILLGFAGLQVALAAGAPLGEHVWGGTQGRVLPTGMRATIGSRTKTTANVVERADIDWPNLLQSTRRREALRTKEHIAEWRRAHPGYAADRH